MVVRYNVNVCSPVFKAHPQLVNNVFDQWGSLAQKPKISDKRWLDWKQHQRYFQQIRFVRRCTAAIKYDCRSSTNRSSTSEARGMGRITPSTVLAGIVAETGTPSPPPPTAPNWCHTGDRKLQCLGDTDHQAATALYGVGLPRFANPRPKIWLFCKI